MGLLDDAIREHLELKRVRGADPSEVIRQEREALGASARQEPVAFDGDGAQPGASDGAHPVDTHAAQPLDGVAVANDRPAGHHETEHPAAPFGVAREGEEQPHAVEPTADVRDQETAEVDIEAMLGVDEYVDPGGPEPAGGDDTLLAAHDEEQWGSPPGRTGV